jgi:hypothetical protein
MANLRQGPQVMVGLHQPPEANLLARPDRAHHRRSQIHPPRLAPGSSCPALDPIPSGRFRHAGNSMAEQTISGKNDSALGGGPVVGDRNVFF